MAVRIGSLIPAAFKCGALNVTRLYLGGTLVWQADPQHLVDAFDRTVASGWGTADKGGPWTTTAGAASVSGSAGRLTLASGGSAAGARAAEVLAVSAALEFRVALDKLPDASGAYVLARVRSVPVAGSQDEYRCKVNVVLTGATTASVSVSWVKAVMNVETVLAAETVAVTSYTAGAVLRVKAAATGYGPTQLRSKVWLDGTSEPAAWQHDLMDSAPSLQAAGQVGVYAQLSAAATVGPLTVSFLEIAATETPSGTAPPVELVGQVWATDYSDPAIASTSYGSLIGLSGLAYNITDQDNGWPSTITPYGRGGFEVPTATSGGAAKPERGVIVRGADVPEQKWPSAIRMEQRTTETYQGRFRTEVHNGIPAQPNTTPAEDWPLIKRGQVIRIRERFYVPPTHQTVTDTTWETIGQGKGWEGRTSTPWPSGSPPWSLEFERDHVAIGGREYQMIRQPDVDNAQVLVNGPRRAWADTSTAGKAARQLKTITPGWHDIILSVMPDPDPAVGWLQVHEVVTTDGVPTLVERFPKTFGPTMDLGYDGTPAPIYWKQGIYRSTAWTVDHLLYFADTQFRHDLAGFDLSPYTPPASFRFVGKSEGITSAPYPAGTLPGHLAVVIPARESSSNTGTGSGYTIHRGLTSSGLSARLMSRIVGTETSTGELSGAQGVAVYVFEKATMGAHANFVASTGDPSYPALTPGNAQGRLVRAGVHATATGLAAPAGTPTQLGSITGATLIGAYMSDSPGVGQAAGTAGATNGAGGAAMGISFEVVPAP